MVTSFIELIHKRDCCSRSAARRTLLVPQVGVRGLGKMKRKRCARFC